MKQLLLLVISSTVLSAWGQTGSEPASAAAPGTGSHTTVIVHGVDGQTRESDVPDSQLTARLASAVIDLEQTSVSQAGCPVQIVDAAFERPARLMFTSPSLAETGPRLRLNYHNFSGKDIKSVVLTGWIKVKENPYQLDAVTHPFELKLSRKSLLAKDVDSTQALDLAANAIGLDRIELSQVSYTDGASWKPDQRNCVYSSLGAIQRAEAR